MAAPSVTMLDVAAAEEKPLRRGILMAIFNVGLPSFVDQLPVENAQSLSQQIVRIADFGTPSTRNVGAAVAAYNAQFTNGTETLKIIENKITIDKVLLEQKNYVQDPVTMQTTAYGQVVKLTANNLLVAGNPGSDVTQPAGLDYRLRNDVLFINQSVDANVLDVDANDANRLTWLDNIDSALRLARNEADVIVVNSQTWLKFRSVLRALKLWATTKDQFDREIDMYRNSKIIDAGMAPAGALSPTGTQVIADDGATSIFGDANTTPMYFVKTGGDDGAKLLQLFPLRVTRVGLDTTDPGQFVIDVTWPLGLLTPQKFCLASVQGLDIT